MRTLRRRKVEALERIADALERPAPPQTIQHVYRNHELIGSVDRLSARTEAGTRALLDISGTLQALERMESFKRGTVEVVLAGDQAVGA